MSDHPFKVLISRQARAAVLAMALVLACFAFAAPALAASFACARATTAVEKKICGDPELSTLDEHLGRYHAAARLALAHAEACLATDQRRWLRTVRDLCKDAACIKRSYLQRLAVLDALQPGASSLRDVELPREMPLVWIVPPAADQVAAPRNRPGKPLVARGRLIDEVQGGDGYVIQARSGEKRLVAALMFLEPVTASALADLARVPGALYEARGQSEAGNPGELHFAPGSCTFLYRASP